MKKISLLFWGCMLSVCCFAQSSISGEWKGAIEVQGQQLVVIFNIEGVTGSYSGTLDIPQQGAKDLPLSQVEQKEDSVFLAFNAGMVSGTFDGILESNNIITGKYSQGAAVFPFKIERQETTDPEAAEPGTGTDLIISTKDAEIGGTLVVPENTSQAPLIILISGSGAQNRDSNIFEFKPFALISEHLKSQGIASFRYDDRQIGKSTGSFQDATLDVLASDTEAIINYFSAYDEFTPEEIILLGHSQGGVVAGKVAAENEQIDQLVLMASTGISLKDVLRFQVTQGFGTGIHDPEMVDQEIDLREKLMKTISEDGDVEQAKQAYKDHYRKMLENLPKAQKSGIPDMDAFVERQASQLVTFYSTPQMQSLLFYDPAEDLSALDIPVLVLFGGKDTQVTIEMNRAPIEQALIKADTEYAVEVFPEANHLFQKANTGQASEYAVLDKKFVDGFLAALSQWIRNH